jgi:hypothetical protein
LVTERLGKYNARASVGVNVRKAGGRPPATP